METNNDRRLSGNKDRPNLPKRLFWDWRYEAIDWQNFYSSIVERVIERGTPEEWEEIIRFYGLPKVIHTLRSDIVFLPDYAIDKATRYFSLPKEELNCYVRKQSKKGHWM